MNEKDCNAVLSTLASANVIDGHINNFLRLMNAPFRERGSAIAGIEVLPKVRAAELFRLRMHLRTVAAVCTHARAGDVIVGRVFFYLLKNDDALGDALIKATLGQNGVLAFPDGDVLHLAELQEASFDTERRKILLQVAKAVQGVLIAAD